MRCMKRKQLVLSKIVRDETLVFSHHMIRARFQADVQDSGMRAVVGVVAVRVVAVEVAI